jgi:ubiquitin C-terminal hydrolase
MVKDSTDDYNIDNSVLNKVNTTGGIPNVPFIPNQPKFDRIDKFISTDKYSGLSNQGSTCYLNSLLQSLFMTPEFRMHLLSWRYNESIHGAKEDCIPYQLQKLFARLQLKLRRAEETRDLTKSFQWDSSEVFRQHDIQELCRVLFEAIEMSLGEGEENFINNLYEGGTESVVKCLECNNESIRPDSYLDISLPIRNEFEKIYNASLEMAFDNFVKPEILEKDNQYFCEKCDKKVNQAAKFLRFVRFPNILFIQLSRFEFDMQTGDRKKIYDSVSFPLNLDLNKFIGSDGNQYELFSIVIHSGTAMGGHYYAYIKSFEDNKWYNFNDSSVCEIEIEELPKIFGSGTYSSPTGYVLMYQRKQSGAPVTHIDDSVINEDLKKEIDLEAVRIREEERVKKEKQNALNVKVLIDGVQKGFDVKKTDTVAYLKDKVLNGFEINTKLSNTRLRLYNNVNGRMLDIFDKEDITLCEYDISAYKTYTLEFRTDEIGFEEYDPDAIYINVFFWREHYMFDKEKYSIDSELECLPLKTNKRCKLGDLLKKIRDILNIEGNKTLLIMKKIDYSAINFNLTILNFKEEDYDKELFLNAIYENCKLFIEIAEGEDYTPKFKDLFSDRLDNVLVRFNIPLTAEVKLCQITAQNYKWDHEVEVNKRWSMSKVKQKMADYLNIKPEQFIMKKYSHNGSEIKDLNEIFNNFTTGNMNIFIQYGKPLSQNEQKVTLVYCELDFSHFKIFPYRFTELKQLIVDLSIQVKDLKKIFIEELVRKDIMPPGCTEDDFIIREQITEKPGKIYNDEAVLSSLGFVENKRIIIQEYKKEKYDWRIDKLQLTLRFWDQANWSISEPVEIQVNKNIKLKELSEIVIKYFPHISSIGMNRVINGYNVYMDDFLKLTFYNVEEKKDSSSIDGSPFYIQSEGSVLL